MPNLEVDIELAEFLAANNHPRAPGAVREWRDAGYFAPREAPGAGRGRLRSSMSDEDKMVALRLAEALDSLPRRVKLSEAAVAAWGSGAPVSHGRPTHPNEGLRGALVEEVADLLAKALGVLELDRAGSRKARAALAAAGPGDAVRAVLEAVTGRAGDLERAVKGLGLEQGALKTALVARNPHDPRSLQVMPRLARFFEGPASLANLADVAKHATRETLDRNRVLAARLLGGPMAKMWEHAVTIDGDGGPPGWNVAMYALALSSYPPAYTEHLRRVAPVLTSRNLAAIWSPPGRHALGRGRPKKR